IILKNLNILLIGGDARYLEVIDTLAADGANIYLIGYESASFDTPNIFHTKCENLDLHTIDAILLPVSGTDASGKIKTSFSDESIYLTEDMVTQTPKHCIICTGISNSFLDKITRSSNRRLVRLFARDDLAIYNSIPTAEGALSIAMEHTDYTIHGSSVMILGFGRVGITVARMFSAVGANVSVCVRKSADIARMKVMGLKPVRMKDLNQKIGNVDICINTIPHLVINSTVLSSMQQSALIIDLASSPGGVDFDFAKKHDIQTIHGLGLPGKVAPKTAGKVIAEVFTDVLAFNNN